MNVPDAIKQKRTIRIFTRETVEYSILEECVDCARLSSSARNAQPLEYIIIDDPAVIGNLIPSLYFGGLISEDGAPRKGHEPAALIAILVKPQADPNYYRYDVGIAAQNIALAAFSHGIGTCMMGAIKRDELKTALNVPADFILDLMLAIGYPAEQPVTEDTSSDPKYYRQDDVLHVPKRCLESISHRNGF